MIELLRKFSDFCKKNVLLIIFNCVIVGLVFGSRIFSLSISVDTDLMITIPYFKYNWLEIGRWGLILFQKIFNMRWFNPYIECALAYLVIVLFLLVYCFLFDLIREKNKLNYYVFCGLFITHPVFALQWFFRLQAFEIALSILFIPVSLIFLFEWIERKNIKMLLLSIILAIISFSCYQTNVILYISSVLICFLLKYNRENDYKKNIILSFKMFLVFLISFISNTLISNIFFVKSEYLSDSVYWHTNSINDCIKNILSYIKEVLFGSVIMTKIFFILVLVLVILFLFNFKKNKKLSWYSWLVTFVLVISPFLLSFYMGGKPFYRSQYVLPFVIAAGFMYILPIISLHLKKNIAIYLKCIVVSICAFTIVVQSQTTLRIWYTEDIRYSQDYNMLQSVMKDLQMQQLNYHEKPVVFVGKWDAPLNPSTMGVIEMVGISQFSMFSDTEPQYYYSTLGIRRLAIANGYNLLEPTIENCNEAKIKGKELPAWPNEGYSVETDEIIIVKLSDY